MEDKRLDLDAPLLSVRRHTTASSPNPAVSLSTAGTIIAPRWEERTPPLRSALPFYKSELKSGPVRNPGVVPFIWEQKPGQPKGEAISRLRPLPAPPPPPGRILKDRERERLSGESNIVLLDLVRNVCEKKLGENPTTPTAAMAVEDEDRFSDAMESLSRSESFFINCSLSGLSGIHDAMVSPGSFSADPQVRDFMMGRFLPAAQAMSSGSLQFASRKPPKMAERAANVEHRLRRVPLPYQHTPKFVAGYPRDPRKEIGCSDNDDDDDDESYEFDGNRNFSSKACGLLPRFCLKSSFCLLNPIPGVKVGDRRCLPPPTSRKISNIRLNKSALAESENELWEAVYKQKLGLEIHNQGQNGSKSTSESILDGSSSCLQFAGSRETLFEIPKRDSKYGKIDGFEFFENDRRRYSALSSSHVSQQGSDARNSIVDKPFDLVSEPFPVISLSNPSSTDDEITGNEIMRSANVDSVKDQRFDDDLVLEKYESIDRKSLLPPPLPTIPSESWLSRTLPSISSKIQSGQAFLGIQVPLRKQAFHSSSMEPKLGSDSKPSKLQNLQISCAVAEDEITVNSSIEQLCEISSTQPNEESNFKASKPQPDQMLDAKPSKPKLRKIRFADVLMTPLSPRSEM